MKKPKVIAIVGPTASGKSGLAVWLATQIQKVSCGAEIISADSRQVYRGLNLGTGKVTTKEMAGVPHHLLNVASPTKQFSANDFVRLARAACSSILQKTNIPIVVGGTGFYIDALLGRLVLPNVAPNPRLRARLEKLTAQQLFAQLKKLDPRRASTIETQHKRRLIRALEIASALGKSPLPTSNETYDVLWLGLNPGEATLKKNIHLRLKMRLTAGMLAEAKRLHAGGLSYKRMEELGLEYHYLARILKSRKKLSANKNAEGALLHELENAINHYAKRQMRWFKRNKDIHWVSGKAEALRLAKSFISS